jgi:hypothetical protein
MLKIFKRTSLSLTLLGTLSACGSSSNGNSGDGGSPATWSNTAMQNLVASRCATSGCHDGAVSPNYKSISESSMKSDSNALSQVNAGLMPKGSSLTATDKATFQNFYK